MVTIRTSTRIATLLVSIMLIPLMTNTAEAWHRHRHVFHWHHRHHFHHRYHHKVHFGWSGIGGYRWIGGYHPRRWHRGWHGGWHVAHPLYSDRFYYAPVDCYGWGGGWNGYGWGGSGYGWSWLSSNEPRIPVTTSEEAPAVVAPEPPRWMIAERLTNETSAIVLNVEVPDDARVYVNGLETTAVGGTRKFVVNGAKLNAGYKFVVRAELAQDDGLSSQTKTVQLRGGQTSALTFDLRARGPQVVTTQDPLDTTLKLHVPDAANVYLAGHQTRQTGEERIYVTKRLQAGERWEDYGIRVTWNDGGQEQTREKRITLVAGESHELDFAPEPRLAAR